MIPVVLAKEKGLRCLLVGFTSYWVYTLINFQVSTSCAGLCGNSGEIPFGRACLFLGEIVALLQNVV